MTGAVAWFTKDLKQPPLGPLHLDALKLQQANKIYFTAVPKGNRKRCMSSERVQMIAAIFTYFIFIIAAFLVFSIYIRIYPGYPANQKRQEDDTAGQEAMERSSANVRNWLILLSICH